MNTNTMELNINEMEQVNGGLNKRCETERVKRDNVNNPAFDAAVKAVGSAACLAGRVAYNWIAGLFD